MEDTANAIDCSEFIKELLTGLRKLSLYTPNHPAVASSVKSSYLALEVILNSANTLSLSLSADNRLLIEVGKAKGVNLALADALAPYFKKLDIESFSFSSGISEEEISEFMKILAIESAKINNAGLISEVFKERGIQHIKIARFSYVKIKKDKEVVVKKAKEPKVGPGIGSIEGVQKRRKSAVFGAEFDALKKENEELKQELKKKIVEKEKIDNIVRHIADGLVVIDAEGKIVMANPAAESLLGISKQDVGKLIREVVTDEHLLALVKNVPAGEGEEGKNIELFSHDEATKKVVKASSAVIEDNLGNTMGIVTTLNDITKQKEIEKLKDGFLANISHELRTPIVAVEKSMSLILGGETGSVSETQKQFLTIAQRNMKRLALLINDLLDLSKLEAGKMQLACKPSVLAEVIEESVGTLNAWAEAKNIRIEKNIGEGIPLLNIDPNRIIQVLNNLIGNAVKFTPEGGLISVGAIIDAQKNEARVSVKDNGIGVSEENLAKIFDKFYQVQESAQNGVFGTGIGLSIVKEIVELHGGKIWVESRKGEGAKFTFALSF